MQSGKGLVGVGWGEKSIVLHKKIRNQQSRSGIRIHMKSGCAFTYVGQHVCVVSVIDPAMVFTKVLIGAYPEGHRPGE